MVFTAEEIHKRISPVMERNHIKRAVLFGSYGKGEATEDSDIDLLVEGSLRGLDFVGFMEDVRQSLDDKEVDILDASHVLPNSRIADEITRTGVIIYDCKR